MGHRRIRTIKPELLSDAKMRRLNDRDWRLFVSLILLADDEGRFEADVDVIGPDVFGYQTATNDSTTAIDSLCERATTAIDSLCERDLISVWEVDGRRIGELRGWKKHQRIQRPTPSMLPPRSIMERSRNDHGSIMEASVSPPPGSDPIRPDPTRSDLERLYALYPRKEGKRLGMEAAKKLSPSKLSELELAIRNYAASVAAKDTQYVKHFSTFMNNWEDYITPPSQASAPAYHKPVEPRREPPPEGWVSKEELRTALLGSFKRMDGPTNA